MKKQRKGQTRQQKVDSPEPKGTSKYALKDDKARKGIFSKRSPFKSKK